jgi:hypothetical protein
MKTDFKPVVGHHFDFRADWGSVDCQVLAVEPNKVLSYTCLCSRECRHLDPHGNPPAHGAVGRPAGSAAGLPGRKVRVAASLCDPAAALGADRLKSAGTIRC